MPVLLHVDRLSHQYEEEKAVATLQHVSFSVKTGQICAIVGESGSGKTTLLRLISGKLDSTQGTIRLSGKKVTGPSYNLVPGHPDIRTVFQDFALSPNLNVYQNIAHVLRAYRRDYREARTRELIERFYLTGQEKQFPATLSGGEKQRVALARALAEEPALLLMDEPFSQVDPPLKRRLMREVIATLHETSGTALFVTHDAHDALSLADQMVVLEGGGLVQQGTPQQVYDQPVSPYVAQLVGECSVVDAGVFRQWYPKFVTNDATYVGIRPEHVRLVSDGEGISGRVRHSSYQGSHYEITVGVADEVELMAYSDQPLTANAPVVFNIIGEKIIRFAQ